MPCSVMNPISLSTALCLPISLDTAMTLWSCHNAAQWRPPVCRQTSTFIASRTAKTSFGSMISDEVMRPFFSAGVNPSRAPMSGYTSASTNTFLPSTLTDRIFFAIPAAIKNPAPNSSSISLLAMMCRNSRPFRCRMISSSHATMSLICVFSPSFQRSAGCFLIMPLFSAD